MFCRKCGKTLLDGDRFCSYCGAQVIERTEHAQLGDSVEEVVYNHEASLELPQKGKISIEVPKKTIAQTWHEINEKNIDKTRPHWNLEGFPTSNQEPRKTEDIKVDWNKRQLRKFGTTLEEKTENQDKELPKEIHNKNTEKDKADIFDIFDKQLKEEGQSIKDIKNKDTLIFHRSSSERLQPENQKHDQSESACESESITLEQELFKYSNDKDKIHTPEEEQIDKFYTFSQKNEEFQKLLDKEYERLKKTTNFIPPEPKIPSNIERLEINVPVEQAVESLIPSIKDEKNDLVNDIAIDSEIEKTENLEESQVQEQSSKEPEKEFKEQQTIEEPVLPWEQMESPLAEFTDDDNKKKISPMTVIFAIIIALLLFEIAILGIKCFWPGSSAATFINDKLGVAVNWVDSLKTKTEDKDIKEDKGKSKDEEVQQVSTIPQQPDPFPNPDKEALVAEALAYNVNIKSITADDNLVYIKQKDYGDKNINNSRAIENNIWYQDEAGNTIYYDKEIVKAIIQFDSAWIDYVNKKDPAVLDLTKEESQAYKNAKNSKIVGKVTESFDTLKIGEIRQGENTGFYIWVYETITMNKNGTPNTVNYNYVYYLEPVEKQMKVVSYKKL